jgi:hypothetical protein
MLLGSGAGAQTSASAKSVGSKGTSQSTVASLDAQAQKYLKMLTDPDYPLDADSKGPLTSKWINLTCQSKSLKFKQSGIDPATASVIYQNCTKRMQADPAAALAAAGLSATAAVGGAKPPAPPAGSSNKPAVPVTPMSIAKPTVCLGSPPQIPFSPTAANNNPIQMDDPNVNRSKQTQLNASSSGGEINTKSIVWLGYINRLRYTASLGGVVTVIAPPTLPWNQIFAAPQAGTAPSKGNLGGAQAETTAKSPTDQQTFDDYATCANSIQASINLFQTQLIDEELELNNAKLSITNLLNSLQPVVGSASEAWAAADLTILPHNVAPPFPVAQVASLQTSLAQFTQQYTQLKDWAAQSPQNSASYATVSAQVSNLSTILGHYLNSAVPSNQGAASQGAANQGAANQGAANQSPANQATTNQGGASSEVADYEASRLTVDFWREQFRRVAGARVPSSPTSPAKVIADYFIVDYKPQCGAFFGQGTSTQMQLTVVDSLNPSAKPSPVNLDKVVCQPAISISSGLGLSFVQDQTPAFVATVEKDAHGNPVLDAKGNPVIVQGLGYSSQSNVRPAYALQVNASLWAPRTGGYEIHWSAGAMLTSATGGATTDIITGPTISFRKRAVFVSPMYDLGLRTTYLNGFTLGMPQGNLTSPPTHQVWKSGFGLTITFPFSSGTNTTNSSSGGTPAPATPPATTQPPKTQ